MGKKIRKNICGNYYYFHLLGNGKGSNWKITQKNGLVKMMTQTDDPFTFTNGKESADAHDIFHYTR